MHKDANVSYSSPCGSFSSSLFRAQSGQDKYVLQHLVTRCSGGTYVEFGARDGERESNTYFFEKSLGWRGLLVEGDPAQVMGLHTNRPGAVKVEGAICPSGMQNVSYLSSRIGGFSGFAESFEPSRRRTVTKRRVVRCFQLADLLRSNGMGRVDYMTIDTEGSEAMLIEDFPWDQFEVKVVQVEQLDERRFRAHIGHQKRIEARMAMFGYRLEVVLTVRKDHTYDLIFVRDDGRNSGMNSSTLVRSPACNLCSVGRQVP
jgi:hypothetical protein